MDGNLTLGLDLGQSRDPSVLVAVERVQVWTGRPVQRWRNGDGVVRVEAVEDHWMVRGVRRWPLGTPYTAVVRDLADLIDGARLYGAVLRFDATGVGRAVRDVLKAEWRGGRLTDAAPSGMSLTSGRQPGEGTMPKRDIVAAVQDALLRDRLHIAPSLADAGQVRREMEAFRVTVSAAGNESFNAAREADHDDSVTALGLVLVRAHNRTPPRTLAADFFRTQVLTGAEDAPARYLHPPRLAGQLVHPETSTTDGNPAP